MAKPHIFADGSEVFGHRAQFEDVRTCRICDCTDGDCTQCIEASGRPCFWVADDLCSRCEEDMVEVA